MITLIFSVVIFTTFIALVWHKFGVLNSISYTFYRLEKSQRWIFTIALWLFSIPIIIYGGLNGSALLFLSGGAIVWTGAVAAYNSSDLELKVHITSASFGVIAGLLHLVVNLHLYYLVLGAVITGLLIRIFSQKYVWWVEVLAFYTILTGLIWTTLG
jgi:hypothetical protein